MKLRNDWLRLWVLTVLGTMILVLFACGKGGVDDNATTVAPSATCGDWLGSVDLAGTCRLNPPTSGALEVT